VIVGRDTRESGNAIFYALSEGLHAEGIGIFDGGVVPTPAVAKAVLDLDLPMGVVITASHNPASDNGIKFFGPGGCKFSSDEESAFEQVLDEVADQEPGSESPPVVIYDALRHYLSYVQEILPAHSMLGWKVFVDCANGPTSFTTPAVLEHLGATVTTVGVSPNGHNINDQVGSEYAPLLSSRIAQLSPALAIAHDGDGDRLILLDEHGKVLDGDAIMAILAHHWLKSGRLRGNTLVATIVSNAGLQASIEKAGGKLLRAEVGDRNVAEWMRRENYVLGGESSGHFIASEYLPAGDGLIALLLVIEAMKETGSSLSKLAKVYKPFPQVKRNLDVASKPSLDNFPELWNAVSRLETKLGSGGRILLRYSGTEPKIRLLVEGENETVCSEVLDMLEVEVRKFLS
jgi:phosphoglucosamine mutase